MSGQFIVQLKSLGVLLCFSKALFYKDCIFHHSLVIFPFTLHLQISCYGCSQCDLLATEVLWVLLVLSLNSANGVNNLKLQPKLIF